MFGFAACVCAAITYTSVQFVNDSYIYKDTVLNNFPAWIAQSVIPFSFGVMSLRFVSVAYKVTRVAATPGETACR